MFQDLFILNQNQDNTMNADNYIFRSIKLEKELNKIKKKIHSDMGNKELRKILPFEQIMKNALKDMDENNEEEEADLTDTVSKYKIEVNSG